MQFESKQQRTIWLNLALGFVPDALIAWALASTLDGGFFGFVLAFIGLQVLYILIWAKNSIWAWALFKLKGQKFLVEHITDYLRKNNYPEPDDYEKSAEGYLTTVQDDEHQPVEIRMKAAASLAEMNFMTSQGQVQNHIRLSIAYEEALENHKKSFTKSG